MGLSPVLGLRWAIRPHYGVSAWDGGGPDGGWRWSLECLHALHVVRLGTRLVRPLFLAIGWFGECMTSVVTEHRYNVQVELGPGVPSPPIKKQWFRAPVPVLWEDPGWGLVS